MNRLQAEFHRLYLPHSAEGANHDCAACGLIDAAGRVRALLLGLARPADWPALAALWRGVQMDLGLPAPAIAVNGIDGYQLWFALAQPVPVAQASAFLDALRLRYLGSLDSDRVALFPALDAPAGRPGQRLPGLPACQTETGHWSAFVAPDLAAVFSDEPWIDVPPTPDGQADLLSRIAITPHADFQQALEQLRPALFPASGEATGGRFDPPKPESTAPGDSLDPKRFLLAVMNDPTVELHLRIEAAKALLPGFEDLRRG